MELTAPAYVTKKSLKDSLELDESQVISKAEKREKAYKKYNVTAYLCSQDEIDLALTYKYENQLMTPQELSEYEAKLFKSFSS